MYSLLLLFAVSFASVFILGFQSRNINTGQFKLAAACSIGIGLSNTFVWKHVTMDSAGWAEWITYSVAGGCGIVAAMYVHRRFIGERKPRKDTSYGELRYRAANPEEFKNG